mmetsp:Transcript_24364/g.34851  ORF Transcript_24364/g.34851 Transcript_24364/m.34851 type:complete len:83 (+) Transcript_24364:328-576(+)
MKEILPASHVLLRYWKRNGSVVKYFCVSDRMRLMVCNESTSLLLGFVAHQVVLFSIESNKVMTSLLTLYKYLVPGSFYGKSR